MNKIKTYSILSLILIFLCYWCTRKKGFYEYSSSWDINRIPLIEPYELTRIINGEIWQIHFYKNGLKNLSATGTISKIDSVHVFNNFILLHSGSLYYPALGKDLETWFILNSQNAQLTYSTNYRDVITQIRENNIKGYELYEVNALFNEFESNQSLPPTWNRQK